METKQREGNGEPQLVDNGLLWQIKEYFDVQDAIDIMVEATEEGLTAVEALGWDLEARFGRAVRADHIKRFIGRQAKQVLKAQGYVIEKRGIRVLSQGNIFTCATRYKPAH